jgi:hypothetical protein
LHAHEYLRNRTRRRLWFQIPGCHANGESGKSRKGPRNRPALSRTRGFAGTNVTHRYGLGRGLFDFDTGIGDVVESAIEVFVETATK